MHRKAIKRLAGRVLLGARVHRWIGESAPIIIAFHRVNDRGSEDGLTCSVALFEAYCGFFRRYFRVRSLSRLVMDMEEGTAQRGDLAITFDDGYADNYHLAAPILDRYGLPATFFIATGFVDTTRTADWDQGTNPPHEWMTWDQVRTLHQMGFEIGAHTVNHIDLGVADVGSARSEIEASRRMIEEEIGEPPDNFAYPFGGVANIREETRELVRESGFRCCVSCHGGSNRGINRFKLRRLPLASWYQSPYELGFDLLRDQGEGV